MRGLFITCEGGEGCGKTTHVKLLAHTLRQRGHSVITTREPGGTEVGKEIRSTLLTPRDPAPHPMTELLLFYADRMQHIHNLILPEIARGTIVLCDRYDDSTWAYQTNRAGIDMNVFRTLSRMALDAASPDLILLFDAGDEIPAQRMRARNIVEAITETRIDNESAEFHARVRANFRKRLSDVRAMRLIDSSGSIEDTQALALDAVMGLLYDRSHLTTVAHPRHNQDDPFCNCELCR